MIPPGECPLGRAYCDGCNFMVTSGCSYKNEAYTITREDQKSLYDRKHEELMKLDKETLVEMLIGSRPLF